MAADGRGRDAADGMGCLVAALVLAVVSLGLLGAAALLHDVWTAVTR